MTRKLIAVLSTLAIALCFSRAAAWAAVATHGDVHACCHHAPPAKTPTLSDCCVTTAAVGAVSIVRVDTFALLTEAPALPLERSFIAAPPQTSAPPRIQTYRTAVPARAPPLA